MLMTSRIPIPSLPPKNPPAAPLLPLPPLLTRRARQRPALARMKVGSVFLFKRQKQSNVFCLHVLICGHSKLWSHFTCSVPIRLVWECQPFCWQHDHLLNNTHSLEYVEKRCFSRWLKVLKIACQDQGLEPVTAPHLAFQSDAPPTELSPLERQTTQTDGPHEWSYFWQVQLTQTVDNRCCGLYWLYDYQFIEISAYSIYMHINQVINMQQQEQSYWCA